MAVLACACTGRENVPVPVELALDPSTCGATTRPEDLLLSCGLAVGSHLIRGPDQVLAQSCDVFAAGGPARLSDVATLLAEGASAAGIHQGETISAELAVYSPWLARTCPRYSPAVVQPGIGRIPLFWGKSDPVVLEGDSPRLELAVQCNFPVPTCIGTPETSIAAEMVDMNLDGVCPRDVQDLPVHAGALVPSRDPTRPEGRIFNLAGTLRFAGDDKTVCPPIVAERPPVAFEVLATAPFLPPAAPQGCQATAVVVGVGAEAVPIVTCEHAPGGARRAYYMPLDEVQALLQLLLRDAGPPATGLVLGRLVSTDLTGTRRGVTDAVFMDVPNARYVEADPGTQTPHFTLVESTRAQGLFAITDGLPCCQTFYPRVAKQEGGDRIVYYRAQTQAPVGLIDGAITIVQVELGELDD